jgi:hypothetical protein
MLYLSTATFSMAIANDASKQPRQAVEIGPSGTEYREPGRSWINYSNYCIHLYIAIDGTTYAFSLPANEEFSAALGALLPKEN